MCTMVVDSRFTMFMYTVDVDILSSMSILAEGSLTY